MSETLSSAIKRKTETDIEPQQPLKSSLVKAKISRRQKKSQRFVDSFLNNLVDETDATNVAGKFSENINPEDVADIEEEVQQEEDQASTLSGNAGSEDVSMSTLTAKPPVSPRYRGGKALSSTRRRRLANPEYDARLDNHQQTFVLSAVTMEALRKTLQNSDHRILSNPNKKIAFHGPRRPLLLSYPIKPTRYGRAIYTERPSSTQSLNNDKIPHLVTEEGIPETEDAKDFVRLVYRLRTESARVPEPIPKKLIRPKTVAPAQTKAQLLAKEKGFVLDGVALSNIQDEYAKIQPKLGPAIPPYNSHFDRHVGNYFRTRGLYRTLYRTGQVKERSESIQGRAIDRFHYIGDGHIYMQGRNRAGAGYSRDFVDGHTQFLAEARPMDGYNGKYGFRRNTPLLRNCASPFGTASRSPTH